MFGPRHPSIALRAGRCRQVVLIGDSIRHHFLCDVHSMPGSRRISRKVRGLVDRPNPLAGGVTLARRFQITAAMARRARKTNEPRFPHILSIRPGFSHMKSGRIGVSDPDPRRRQRLLLGDCFCSGCCPVALRIGLSARDHRLVCRGVSADPDYPNDFGRDHLVLQPRARRQGTRRDQRVT